MSLSRRSFLKQGAAGLLSSTAVLPALAAHAAVAGNRGKPLKVCMLSGSKEYKSNESLAAFQHELEEKKLAVCSRAFWTSDDNLPGLEALDDCDVMLLFTKRLKIAGEQLERVKKYCLAGRPIVGLRTASHAFQNWLELDKLVWGGDYSGHYDGGIMTKITVAPDAANLAILSGVSLTESPSKLYKNPKLADDVNLLLRGEIPGHTEPVAWTRTFRGARVFYTSLGGPEDFANESFRRLVVNALQWTTKREQKPG